MKSIMLLFAFVFLSILMTSVFGSTTNIQANATNITTTSTGVVNATAPIHLLNKLTSPVIGIVNIASVILFITFLLIGEILIFKQETEKEKINYKPFAEYFLISLLILAIPEVVSSYSTVIPGMITTLGSSTLTTGVVYETEAIMIIAVLISFAGFLIFIKSLAQMLVDYTDEAKRELVKSGINKIIILLIFIIFSPYVLIVLFLGLSKLLITVNNSFNLSISQTIKTSNLPYLTSYQTAYKGCSASPQFWQIGQVAGCVGTSILYEGTSIIYPYSLQIGIYQAVVGLITKSFSDVALNQLIFSFIFGIVMVVSFAVLDFKILKYLENINTEKEQESFREIKAKILQFTAFMFSPTLYIIFLLIAGAILSVIVGMIFTSSASGLSFSPIPALFTLIGYPTTANIILFSAGAIGIIFLLILIAIVGIFAISKIFASGVFSIATYWYFSDAPHVKAFGERIFYILIAIFIIPVIILFFYSIFFGMIPSLLHGALFSGGAVTTGSAYGYSITSNNNIATLSGPGTSGTIQVSYSCNSQSQISSAITYLASNSGNAQNALGALLYSCQGYITGYAISVLIIDAIFLVALIVGIYLLATGGASLLGSSFTGLTTSLKAGNYTEAFSTLAKGTGDLMNKANNSPFLKPIMNIPKQTYTYVKMPLAGTTEGAVLEGTVGTVGALAMAVPNTMIQEAQKREKQKMLEQAIKDEFEANYAESKEDYNIKKEKVKNLMTKLNNPNLNIKDKKKIYEEINEINGSNKILLPTGMGIKEKEDFLNDMWENHNGNINETVSAWMNDKDEHKKIIGKDIYNSDSFKKSLLTKEYHKNPNNILKLLKTPYYSDVYNEMKENVNTRELVYLRAKENNIAIDTQEKREAQFSQAKAVKNSYNSYKDAMNENGEEFTKIDEGPGSIQEKQAQKEKIKLTALKNFNNISEKYGYTGKDAVRIISGTNNFADMYDTTSEIYANTKTMQESLANLKTTAEKQEAKENIAKLNQSLNLSATELGYTNVEDFIQKAQATPSYKISKIIRDINNSKTEAEKEANKNEFIKMLGNIGLKQSQIKSIEGNEIIQPVLMDAIEKMSMEYSSATSQELGELIKNGYENMANPIMAKTISIPKGILSNVDTNLKAMIANPINQTFKEYYGSIRKLVNTTWNQLMTGSLDTFISTLGEQTNYYSMQIENSKKEIQENVSKLSDKTLSVQERAEIENKIASLKKAIMSAQTEIAINNKTASIYSKIPVFDSILQSVKEWNVAGIDDVVSQYRLQEKITGNQIATIEKEIELKKKELAEKQARIKTVKDSATEVLLEMQIDKLKEKIEQITNEKQYLYIKQQGISDFLNTDNNGVTLDEINEEAKRLSIKESLNNKLDDIVNKNDKLMTIIENYDVGKNNYINEKEKIEKIKTEINDAIKMISVVKTPEDISKINTDNYTDEIKQIITPSIIYMKNKAEAKKENVNKKEEDIKKILSDIAKEKEHIERLNKIIIEKHEKDLPINEEQQNKDEGERIVDSKIKELKILLNPKGATYETAVKYLKALQESNYKYVANNENEIASAIKMNMLDDISSDINVQKIIKEITAKAMIEESKLTRENKANDYSKWLQVIKDNMKEEIKNTILNSVNMFPEKEQDIIKTELNKATKDNIDDVVKNLADSGTVAGDIIYPVFEKINNMTPEDESTFNDILSEGIFENNQNLETMKDLMTKTKSLIEKVGKNSSIYGKANTEIPKAEKITKAIKDSKKKGK